MSHSLKLYFLRVWDFGLGFFVRYHLIGRKKGKRYKQNVILDYIKTDLKKAKTEPFIDSHIGNRMDPQPIWVCWWQGEDQMPPIVKACFNSVKTHSNGHPILLINSGNISQFIHIDPQIESHFNNGAITLTHFSDYIRCAILSMYGGLWIDATIYLTADLPVNFPELFTLKQKCRDNSYISDYRWTGFFMGGDGGARIMKKVMHYLINYWSRKDVLIDYYLIDYIIAALYDTDNECRELIDNVSESNPELHLLQTMLNKPFDKDEFEKLSNDTSYFKLSWKGSYSPYTSDGQKTFYGHII